MTPFDRNRFYIDRSLWRCTRPRVFDAQRRLLLHVRRPLHVRRRLLTILLGVLAIPAGIACWFFLVAPWLPLTPYDRVSQGVAVACWILPIAVTILLGVWISRPLTIRCYDGTDLLRCLLTIRQERKLVGEISPFIVTDEGGKMIGQLDAANVRVGPAPPISLSLLARGSRGEPLCAIDQRSIPLWAWCFWSPATRWTRIVGPDGKSLCATRTRDTLNDIPCWLLEAHDDPVHPIDRRLLLAMALLPLQRL